MKQLYFILFFFAWSFSVIAQTTPTGNSSEVGITEGQLSVSLSGGATYAIPLSVPPGINGVVPQINLNYNSQGGNGLAGYGWTISGISTISRIPSTQFHDGAIDTVDFDSFDRFAFDGQRLVVKNSTGGTYGANGTVYETENFSNVKITSYGTHPNGANFGPAYFVVEYPDGSKAYYGNSSDSRSIADWSITYWENPQGVRISYNYNLDYNSLKIASITYGSLGASTPLNQIQFIYKTRQRLEQAYIGGQEVRVNSILSEIRMLGNGIGYRNYTLSHSNSSLGYERLMSITEKSGDNTKRYNPTVFSYDMDAGNDIPFTQYPTTTINLTGVNSQNTGNITGDFDGDGKIDVILYPITGTSAKTNYTLFTNLSKGSSTTGISNAVGKFDTLFSSSFLEGDTSIGYRLLSKQGWTVVNYDYNMITFSNYSYEGTGFRFSLQNKKTIILPVYTYRAPLNSHEPELMTKTAYFPKKIIEGDFDGDGLTDVLVIQDDININGSTIKGSTYLVKLDARTDNSLINLNLNIATTTNNKLIVADFNGDGKSDLYIFDKGNLRIYGLNESNQMSLLKSLTDASITIDKTILMGDYNGDGKMDFVIPEALNKDNWYFYISRGTDIVKYTQPIGVPYTTPVKDIPGVSLEAQYIANDFNGDGKTDILYQENTVGNNNIYSVKFDLYANKNWSGTNFSFTKVGSTTINNTVGIKSLSIPIFTNHNTINQKLEYALISDNKIISFVNPKDSRKEILLKTVTTGNGVKETITYKPLVSDSSDKPLYTANPYAERYPNTEIKAAPSFQVVAQLEKQSNAVPYKKQLFYYSGAVFNSEGLGFLGFRSTVRTNWYDDATAIISTISKFDPELRGANTESYTVLGLQNPLLSSGYENEKSIVKQGYTPTGTDNIIASQSITLKPNTWIRTGTTFSAKIIPASSSLITNPPTSYISKMVLNYSSNLLANKVFKLQNIKSTQYSGLDPSSTETVTTYDDYNNPITATVTVKEGSTTLQTTTTALTYVSPTAVPYVVGRPAAKTQTITVSGDTMSTEEQYSYTNNLLTQVKKKGTNTDFITESNVYDNFGNITQKSISAPGLASRVTKYQYDSSGRYLTQSTDIEGLSTIFNYNTSNGLVNSETNPYGLTTSYFYDAWFKKTKTTDYLGKSKTISYARSGNNTTLTSDSDDGSQTVDYFDDLGRKFKSSTKDIGGVLSSVEYSYDMYDRNIKVSEPYYGSATQWNTTEYDVYGRTVKNRSFTGKTINISYSGLTTTVNDGVKTKTSVKNAIGKVVSMTDSPGGTITYSYFANGNLKSSNYEGSITTIEQDGWGRKTKLIDPSAGAYSYTYNAFGETTSETTPNGVTTYILNDFGKLTQKTISGINTNSGTAYTYDAATKLLRTSTFTNNLEGNTITTTYQYDGYKRLNQTTENTPYATFTKQLTFDVFGRTDTETSTALLKSNSKSSSKTIKNTYKNGFPWQILDNTTQTVLWATNTVNARGQLVNASLGNGITIANTYDTYGLISQTQHNKGSVNTMTLNTVFDAQRGNLTSRTNNLFTNWSENFTYDQQDRLLNWKNATGAIETQTYDNRGRITQNSVGTYNYTDTNKLYQNTSVSLTPEANNYYNPNKPIQNVAYNAFKCPVEIEEAGIDKVSFTYNDDNARTAMFYGGLGAKETRTTRKYYSTDGSMEIKVNIPNNKIEFITYIGGDGYSAPVIYKLNYDATTPPLGAGGLFYLHRDYQGSILAITNQAGTIVEKRLFDAWGSLINYYNATGASFGSWGAFDRGYTGHEHLTSVGLINMNARLYDPKLHRFLQPDNYVQEPFSTQSYNRYGYCWNNPLKYADYNGEWFGLDDLVVAAATFVIGYVSSGLNTGNWGWSSVKSGLMTAGMSWLAYNTAGASTGITAGSGTLNAAMGNFILNQAASVAISYFIPPVGVRIGDWRFSISPSIAFGNASGIGANLSVTYSSGDFSFSAGIGIMSNSNYNGFGKNSLEVRKSILMAYDDGKTGFSLGSNIWSGDFAQRTGVIGFHSGDFRMMYENDGGFGIKNAHLGDRGDSYRTAALNLSVGEFSAGFNLFTGKRTNIPKGSSPENRSVDGYGRKYTYGYATEEGTKHRLGALTVGYGGYRVGVNSEHVRHAIQDRVIHGMIHDQGFENQSWDWKGYSQYRTSNGFTSW